jgi:hypothetical protein
MMKKLGVFLMAILFSVSVAGLGYAQTKPSDKPADKPAAKPADNPCAAGEMTKKKKTKKLAEKKAACLEKATTDQAKAECEKKFGKEAKKKGQKEAKKKATIDTPLKEAEKGAKPATPATPATPAEPTKK